MSLLTAQAIHKSFGSVEVLKGVDFSVASGELVTIVGSSGAGKSTLLHILGSLDRPDSGQISLNGHDFSQLKGKSLADFRNRQMGFVFQFHHLLAEFTALENVCIPGWIGKRPKQEVEQAAKELLDYLGLSERMHHLPQALSGGEQQRVAVARALINQPAIVFADEPTGNLDSAHAAEMHDLFAKLVEERGQTFVIVTHNETLANMSHRKVVMKDGLIIH